MSLAANSYLLLLKASLIQCWRLLMQQLSAQDDLGKPLASANSEMLKTKQSTWEAFPTLGCRSCEQPWSTSGNFEILSIREHLTLQDVTESWAILLPAQTSCRWTVWGAQCLSSASLKGLCIFQQSVSALTVKLICTSVFHGTALSEREIIFKCSCVFSVLGTLSTKALSR